MPAESSAVIGAPRRVVSGIKPDQMGSSLSSGSSLTPPVRDFAENLVNGFRVDGFLWALLFSLSLTFCTGILNRIFGVNSSNKKEEN